MEVTGTCEALELDDNADVGAVRRRFGTLAALAGLDEARVGDAALIATELASNVLKHARHGGAVLSSVREGERGGVMIAAWDRGPGMQLGACLRDGMSTAGTRGAGLGAVARLASRFDAYTPAGRGSVVVAAVLPAAGPARSRFASGAACVPYPGLQVSGDAWTLELDGDRASIIVCDGLGHGDGAAAAAAAVIAAFRRDPWSSPAEILARADRAAAATRGAAATAASVDLAAGSLVVAGVGNVAVWIAGDALKPLVTQHGTLGHAMPRVREERVAFPAGAALVLCSDGLKSRWSFAEHPGLFARDPATIATVLWRDLARGRDDATVAIVREAVP